MIKIGRALGVNVYADTDDPQKANRLGMLISQAFRPDAKWDWDNEINAFVERVPWAAQLIERPGFKPEPTNER